MEYHTYIVPIAKPGTNATGHDTRGSYCKASVSRG